MKVLQLIGTSNRPFAPRVAAMPTPSGRVSQPTSPSAEQLPSSSFFSSSSSSSSSAPPSLVAVWILLGALGSLLALWGLSYLALRQWDRSRRQLRRSSHEASGQHRWRRLQAIFGVRSHQARNRQPSPPSHPLQIMVRTDTIERWEERSAPLDSREGREAALGLISTATAPRSAAAVATPNLEPQTTPPAAQPSRSPPALRWLIPPPATSQPPPSLGQAVLSSEAPVVPTSRTPTLESSNVALSRQVSWYEAMQDVGLADPARWTMPSRRASEEDVDVEEGETEAMQGHGSEVSNGIVRG